MKNSIAVILKSLKPKAETVQDLERRLAALKEMERQIGKPSRPTK